MQRVTRNRIRINLIEDVKIEGYEVPAGIYDGLEIFTTLTTLSGNQSTSPRYQIELEENVHKNPRLVSDCCDCTALIKSGAARIVN